MSSLKNTFKNLGRGGLLLATLAIGVAACGPEYERTEITGVKQTDLGGNITIEQINVPEGLIIKAHIVVWNDDNVQMPLAVRAVDPSIIEVAGVVNDRDYAFVGLKQGHTQIQFVAEDTVVLTVEADVTAQPALPAP
jgi:hypothetical protein